MRFMKQAKYFAPAVLTLPAFAADVVIDTGPMVSQITAVGVAVVAVGSAALGIYFVARSFGWIKGAAR